MRKLNKIILHCSDSDAPLHDNIEIIREWHKGRGFNDVGYHFYIQKSGFIQRGRSIDVIGSHCYGQNRESIGICLGGKNHFKLIQFATLQQLIHSLFTILGELEIYGHNEFNKNKTCPNFDVDNFKQEYLSEY